jgi:hypothetical protein
MISLTPLLLFVQIGAIGVEAGVGNYLPGTGYGPQAGFFYSHHVFEELLICSSVSYWTKEHMSEEGTTARDCVFSDLSFHQDGAFSIGFLERMRIGIGGGVSLHILKNYAKETTDYGSWLLTDYRTYTLNRLGVRALFLTEVRIGRTWLGVRTAYDVLLMETGERNLFYETGNIRILTVTFVVSGEWW